MSRGPVEAPGVSCPSVQRLPEKQKRWAGRRRGEKGGEWGASLGPSPNALQWQRRGWLGAGPQGWKPFPVLACPFRVPRTGPPVSLSSTHVRGSEPSPPVYAPKSQSLSTRGFTFRALNVLDFLLLTHRDLSRTFSVGALGSSLLHPFSLKTRGFRCEEAALKD